MKKYYQNPEIIIIEIASQQLLAGSIRISENEYNGGSVLSPDGSDLWDDDDVNNY